MAEEEAGILLTTRKIKGKTIPITIKIKGLVVLIATVMDILQRTALSKDEIGK